MRNLQFIVDGQTLAKNNDFSNIIRGTKNYLKCSFEFKGTDWSNCKIAVVFESKELECPVALDINRSCLVPEQMSDLPSFKVRLVGRKGNYQITTNRLLVSQEG